VKSIDRQVAEISAHTRRIAKHGCARVELLSRSSDLSAWQETQDFLRAGSLSVQSTLTYLRERRSRRKSKVDQCQHRESFAGPLIGEHNKSLEARDVQLLAQQAVLRELGDALAWLLLNSDPRLIAPLFAEQTTNTLPTGLGLAGVIQVGKVAHDSGRFFVLENDLTRCIGIGDVTVIPRQAEWHHPVVFEIKTRESDGNHVTLQLIAATTELEADQRLHADFTALFQSSTDDEPRRRNARQESALLEHADLQLTVTRRRAKASAAQPNTHWARYKTVLNRSVGRDYAFDVLEPGVVLAAIRTQPAKSLVSRLKKLSEHLSDFGFGGLGEKWLQISTLHLRSNRGMAPYAPPIALWPIELSMRVDLLTRDTVLLCRHHPNVWTRALDSYGLKIVERSGSWIVQGAGSAKLILDPIEVNKLRFGIGLAALSPRAVAQAIAEQLAKA
jgi:hypothetical protein